MVAPAGGEVVDALGGAIFSGLEGVAGLEEVGVSAKEVESGLGRLVGRMVTGEGSATSALSLSTWRGALPTTLRMGARMKKPCIFMVSWGRVRND